jgi:hypothetical protein
MSKAAGPRFIMLTTPRFKAFKAALGNDVIQFSIKNDAG